MKSEKHALKWHIKQPYLFKNVFQYQMAKFNSAKPQFLLHQPNMEQMT